MAINTTAEWYKFVLAKRGIEDLVASKADDTLALFASRGIVLPSGQVMDSISDLELERRRALTIEDAKLIASQLEQEYAELEVIYKGLIADAEITFQEEEQALLAGLDLEIAAAESWYQMAEQDLALQALVIEQRQSELMNSKTALGLEKEALQQQMLGQDVLLLPYQTTLINARVATITKRLEMIPFLEAIIDKEWELIVYITNSLKYEDDLVHAKEALLDAQKPLMSIMYELANKKTAYANAEMTETRVLINLAEFEVDKLKAEDARVAAMITAQTKENELENIRKMIADVRNKIEMKRMTDHVSLTQATTGFTLAAAGIHNSADWIALQGRIQTRKIGDSGKVEIASELSAARKDIHTAQSINAGLLIDREKEQHIRQLEERIRIMAQEKLGSTFSHYVGAA